MADEYLTPADPKKTTSGRKQVYVESSTSTTLGLTNPQNKTVFDAFGQEVNVFLHCHLRGYDKTGCGEEMLAQYFDKYGAPVDRHHSWSEGYRDVEKQLGLHFDQSANPKNELPLIAGYGGGVHLYQPIKYHDEEPWNITGWVPLENKWCCEKNFFRNRHFFALRGNEIQNDLWDYHPYVEDDTQDAHDSCYEQFVPLGPYKGGYWYYNDVRGRYLHIIAIKAQSYNDDVKKTYDRYNFIVHPLAYRANVARLPDNSVDGMQWAITNIGNEEHFKSPDSVTTWGEKVHGLEIFNDFTYYYSWQPGEDGIFNGTKMNYSNDQIITRYHYWFNTYPHEYGEFLLDSALTMGTYLHPVSANDAFYDRKIVPIQDQTEEELADTEGMERVLLADPKGVLINRLQRVVQQEGCSRTSGQRRMALSRCASDADRKEWKQSQEFRASLPYGEDTVFGYVAILDYEKKFLDCMERNPPPNVFGKDYNYESGLNCLEPDVIKKLQEGQWYGHTGVFDFFEYSAEYPIPFTVPGQEDKLNLCSELKKGCPLIFTFPKCKSKPNALLGAPVSDDHLFRYQIQTVAKGTEKRSVVTTYGFFKLNNFESPIQLDLSNYACEDICWIRFSIINTDNPMKRAWFPAIRGPAFAKSADTIVDIADTLPNMRDRIVHTTDSLEDGKIVIKEGEEFTPSIIATTSLDIVFTKCSYVEQNDIYSYFFQAYPVKQPVGKDDCHIQHSKLNDKGEAFAPRILESPHGYFQLCDEYPTRINMKDSWDETTVVNHQVSVYSIDAISGQPKPINHLILDVLPELYYPVIPAAEIAPRR